MVAVAIPLAVMLAAVPATVARAQTASAQFVQVVAGYSHTCGLDGGGNAFCWGHGGSGQLGDGNNMDRTTPVPVRAPAGVTFTQLTIGAGHTCGTASDTRTYCWGGGFNGVLGTGSTTNEPTPVPVSTPAGVTFTRVNAGGFHTCALGNNARTYCWGQGGLGELGDGNATHSGPSPVAVNSPAGVIFTQLSPGSTHTCALGNDAKTYCWGYGFNGAIGNGSTANQPSPVPVSAPAGVTFTQLASGQNHTCALGNDTKTYCWGFNGAGQVGDDSTVNRSSPVAVSMPAGVTFIQITAGYNQTCALGSDSKPYCWGQGNTIQQRTPVAAAVPGGVTFTHLTSGSGHTCALANDAKTYCWGMGNSGQLGNGQTGEQAIPVEVMAAPPTGPYNVQFTQVAAGSTHTCAVGNDSRAYCWGQGLAGRLGDGNTVDRANPAPVSQPDGVIFTRLAASETHTCAIGNDSRTYCWGEGGSGQLGYGGNSDRLVPSPVAVPSGVIFTQVAVGREYTCAEGNDSKAYCWGTNLAGQLGDGTTTGRPTPTPVMAPGGVNLTHLTLGGSHACALGNNSQTYCWGGGWDGQLGNGANAASTSPVVVSAPAGVILTEVSAGSNFTCALGNDSKTYCWGDGFDGHLGNGSLTSQSRPAEVSIPAGVIITEISAGAAHTCGLGNDAKTYCWGAGSFGRLGNGDGSLQLNPVTTNIPGGVTFTQLSTGYSHTCALGNDSKTYCWGWGSLGQLGNGQKADQSNPVAVGPAQPWSGGSGPPPPNEPMQPGDRLIDIHYTAVCRGCALPPPP